MGEREGGGVGEREGGGVGEREGGGVGGKPKAGNTIHSVTNSSIVSPVEHINSHSQPGRRRRSLAAVWHTMWPY